jgi:hypothetical protein
MHSRTATVSCPGQNLPACELLLTCSKFGTHSEFLPQHHAQRQATLQISSAAEADGHGRVAEMNRQVAGNLGKVIATPKPTARMGRRRPVHPDPLSEAAAQRHEPTRRRHRPRQDAAGRGPVVTKAQDNRRAKRTRAGGCWPHHAGQTHKAAKRARPAQHWTRERWRLVVDL